MTQLSLLPRLNLLLPTQQQRPASTLPLLPCQSRLCQCQRLLLQLLSLHLLLPHSTTDTTVVPTTATTHMVLLDTALDTLLDTTHMPMVLVPTHTPLTLHTPTLLRRIRTSLSRTRRSRRRRVSVVGVGCPRSWW